MSGLVKPKEYKLEDSNVANLGSDLDKKIRKAAAETEDAWKGAGSKLGLEIWRIEKFHVVHWPKEKYGSFYDGDSYICLNTYKKTPDSPALAWDVHFWLGKYTTQDEAGTAAYKTVELDDLLNGAPIQHREVQGHESSTFMNYFKGNISILSGGVDSGFKKVEPHKYAPKLLQLKGKKNVRITEVDLSKDSMNYGDVFILDLGLKIYQWNGSKAGPMEKMKAASHCRAIDADRGGRVTKYTLEADDDTLQHKEFFEVVKTGKIKSAEEGGKDDDADAALQGARMLFRLSDAGGSMTFTKVAEGVIKRTMLHSDDVFVFDSGKEVFAWVGKNSSAGEKKTALSYAQKYLTDFKRPNWMAISRVCEGGEGAAFNNAFN